jgi:hypothetical protein
MPKDPQKTAATPEPPPKTNTNPAIADLVEMDLSTVFTDEHKFPYRIRTDLRARDATGSLKYGTRLQPFNGRNAINDLYQEVLDGVQYARQALYEEQQKKRATDLDLVKVLASTDNSPKLGRIYHKLLDLAVEVAELRDQQDGCGSSGFEIKLSGVKFMAVDREPRS